MALAIIFVRNVNGQLFAPSPTLMPRLVAMSIVRMEPVKHCTPPTALAGITSDLEIRLRPTSPAPFHSPTGPTSSMCSTIEPLKSATTGLTASNDRSLSRHGKCWSPSNFAGRLAVSSTRPKSPSFRRWRIARRQPGSQHGRSSRFTVHRRTRWIGRQQLVPGRLPPSVRLDRIWPVQTFLQQGDSEAAFDRDVVLRVKARYYGGISAVDSVFVTKVTGA